MILPWVFQKKPNQLSDYLYVYKLISGIKENSIALGYLLNGATITSQGQNFLITEKSIDERNYADYHSTLHVLHFLLSDTHRFLDNCVSFKLRTLTPFENCSQQILFFLNELNIHQVFQQRF